MYIIKFLKFDIIKILINPKYIKWLPKKLNGVLTAWCNIFIKNELGPIPSICVVFEYELVISFDIEYISRVVKIELILFLFISNLKFLNIFIVKIPI